MPPGSAVPIECRYVHTNLIARDWRRLARFYQEVFGCTPVPPERHLQGDALERGSGVHGAVLDGVHMRLPGGDTAGPTLEIFSYASMEERPEPCANRPGYGHIAFSVGSVERARGVVLSSGGAAVGEIVTLDVPPKGRVTWCYVTDPEGNIIELQSWSDRAEGSGSG